MVDEDYLNSWEVLVKEAVVAEDIVFMDGSSGVKYDVSLAIADGTYKQSGRMYVADHAATLALPDLFVRESKVIESDTSAKARGDLVYLSSGTAGAWTYSDTGVPIGEVIVVGATGYIVLAPMYYSSRSYDYGSDAANLGAGAEVYAAKIADVLRFRSLTAGNGIELTQSGTEIDIATDMTRSWYVLQAVDNVASDLTDLHTGLGYFDMEDYSVVTFHGVVLAREHLTGGPPHQGDIGSFTFTATVKRDAGAGTTVLVASSVTHDGASAIAAGFSVAVDAVNGWVLFKGQHNWLAGVDYTEWEATVTHAYISQ